MTPIDTIESTRKSCLSQGPSLEKTDSHKSILEGCHPRTQPWTGKSIILSTFNIRYAAGARLISGSFLRRLGLGSLARRPALIDKNLEAAARIFSSDTIMPPADIIAIQEADIETKRAARRNIAASLAEGLSMAYAHAPAETSTEDPPKRKQWYLDFEEPIDTNDGGDTGIAMLSRFDLGSVQRIDLPAGECPWRPKVAMASFLSCGRSEVVLINAHIDPHASIPGQLEQHRAILKFIAKYDCPVIYAGDFNTLSKAACDAMLDLLQGDGFATPLPTKVATWRAGAIRLHTDWIFARDATVKRWGVAKPLSVSDHWPVWAEIDFPQLEAY